MFTRTSMFAALLVMSTLTSCITNRLWDDPPDVPAELVVAAGLSDSHELVVEIAFENKSVRVFTYELRKFPPPSKLKEHHLASSQVLRSKTVVELPIATAQSAESELRFAPGTTLHLSVIPPHRLLVTSLDLAHGAVLPEEPSPEVEYVTIPNEGVDWGERGNWGRAVLTLPAVILDVLTSPFQIGWYIYMLSTGQVCG